MGTRPVTPFQDCVFRLSADGNARISNSSPIGDFPSRVTERLEHWAATAPNRVFLARRTEAGWREVTYANALDAARRIGQALLDRGLNSSRPVLILSGNSIEHAVLSLACLHVGVPFVPLATAYSLLSSDHVRLRDIVALVQPALVFADDGMRYVAAIRDCVGADTEVVLVHGEAGRAATPFHQLLATEPCRDVEVAAAAILPDTVAKVLFTSGSTGFPKGVMSTQHMICSTLQTLLAWYPVLADEPPVLVDWTPWNHVFGGTVNFGLALYNGGTFYIDEGKPLPGLIETTIRNLREVAPVIYSSVPKAFEELVPWLRKDAELRNRFFSRMKIFQYSGASIPQTVYDAFDELALQTVGERIPWVGAFGSTEAGPMLADLHAGGSSAGRVGLPVPGVTLKLTQVDGKLEARVKSRYVTPGYWKREDLTAAAFDEEGFYCTGDALNWVDEHDPKQGLRYDGRIAEDFKLATGIWVRVGLLRNHLLKQLAPEVRDVVIVGENRRYIAVLAVASTPEIAESEAVRARVRTKLTALARQATGSSQRVLRLSFLTKSLSIDAGELTEKGAISQRGIVRRHADLVEELYSDKPADNIVCADFENPASAVTNAGEQKAVPVTDRSTGMSEVSLRTRLIGAWELVNFVVRDTATNAEDRPWGEHPLGLILYTHDGYVSAQLQRPGRAPFVNDDPFGATAVEYATAGSSCIAYSGRFFVDEASQSVCHEMAVSFFPNWLGQRQRRKVKMAGEFLQLIVDRPNGEPKIATLTWRRAQPN